MATMAHADKPKKESPEEMRARFDKEYRRLAIIGVSIGIIFAILIHYAF